MDKQMSIDAALSQQLRVALEEKLKKCREAKRAFEIAFQDCSEKMDRYQELGKEALLISQQLDEQLDFEQSLPYPESSHNPVLSRIAHRLFSGAN